MSAWGAGRALSQVIAGGQSVTISHQLRWLAQIADGLSAVHRSGEAHGSVSPQEVLIDEDGNARITEPSPMDRTGPPLWHATPYAAPERLAGEDGQPDGDLYSLGRLALALLSGTLLPPDGPPSLPERGPRNPALPARASEQVRELIAALTHQDPAQRPDSAETVAGAFQRLSRLPAPRAGSPLPELHLGRTRADGAWGSWIQSQLAGRYLVETVLLDSEAGLRFPAFGPEHTVLLLSRTAVLQVAARHGWWEQVAAAVARGSLLLVRVDDVEAPAELDTTPVLDLLGAAEQDTRALLLDAVATLTGEPGAG